VTMFGDGAGLLRSESEGGRVTYMELFFDLVYVLAVTQLTQLLLQRLSIGGALQTLLLLLALWWAWIDTAWVTNWFAPDRTGVRLMLVALMLLSLIMAATLPEAFDGRGLAFASAYAAGQIGRTLFAVASLRGQPRLRRNFERILVWKAVAGALWVAGGFTHGPTRTVLWAVAVVIEYSAAAMGFYVPGLGRSGPADWQISGGHLAERCHLFLIVTLGESILVTGTVFGDSPLNVARVAAFVSAFAGTVALWWVYFDRSAEAASSVITESSEPGRLGRSAYTYDHIPMVGGIIVAAVGDELTIAHPGGHAGAATVAAVLGGPALFLIGHLLFKRSVFEVVSTARLGAIGALALLVPVALLVPPLALSILATLVVAGVAVVDSWRPRRVDREVHTSPA
jgi:low temperature requirement protein LtrA